MGTYIFLQLFGKACKLYVSLNTDMRSKKICRKLNSAQYIVNLLILDSLT